MVRTGHVERYLRHIHIWEVDMLTIAEPAECSPRVASSIIAYPTRAGGDIIQFKSLRDIPRSTKISQTQIPPSRFCQIETIPVPNVNNVIN